MKWHASPEWDFEAWNPWFAWRPVRVGNMRVWLERLERQPINPNTLGTFVYEYRFPGSGP